MKMEDVVLLKESWRPRNVLPEERKEISVEGNGLTSGLAFTQSPLEAALSRTLDNGPFRISETVILVLPTLSHHNLFLRLDF
jgi:hypothetical protein